MSSKLRRKNRSNVYENDYDLLYTTDEFEELPDKIKHVSKKQEKRQARLLKISEKQSNTPVAPKVKEPKKQSNKSSIESKASPSAVFSEVISSKSVDCSCNKCNSPVQGELLSSLYYATSGLEIPFVRYTCKSCGHFGHRSVASKGLPPKQFEAYYF